MMMRIMVIRMMRMRMRMRMRMMMMMMVMMMMMGAQPRKKRLHKRVKFGVYKRAVVRQGRSFEKKR